MEELHAIYVFPDQLLIIKCNIVYLRREKEYGWWKVTSYSAMPSELAFIVLKWSGVKASRGATGIA